MNRTTLLSTVLVLALGACTHDIKPYNGDEASAKDMDVLFVIDDSTNHANYAAIASQLGDLQTSLSSIDGQLPSLHVGVVTTDLGVTATGGAGSGAVGACTGTGKDGKLQKFASTATDGYLSAERGGTKNFTGNLVAELTSLTAPAAATGGCEYGQPLEAMRKALDPAVNPGFVRDDATLAVVFLTNRDDCSLAKADFLTDASIGGTPELRCFTAGVVCDDDSGSPGPKKNCHPREDSTSLVPVSDYSDFLADLKDSRSDITVSAVAGSASDVNISTFGSLRNCQGPGGIAYPAVRTDALVADFGGTVVDSCTPTNAYQQIGGVIATRETTCVPAADVNRCQVVDSDGDTQLAKCANASDAGPCWLADTTSGVCGSDQVAIRVKRGATPATADSHIQARCFIN